MAKDLRNDEDVKESVESFESGSSIFLRIPEGQTPIKLLDGEYVDGYVHWVDVDGNAARVVCLGGLEGKGWAPDECPICKVVADLYKEAKTLKNKGKDRKSDQLRKKAGRMRARYEAHFVAAKGELVKEKVAGGKKRLVPDFDDAEIGVLSFSKQQFEDFVSLRQSTDYPFMKSGEDLVNRVILIEKKRRGDAKYPTLKFTPSRHTIDLDLEYDEDEIDLSEGFEVDEDQAEKVAESLSDEDDTIDGVDLEEDVEEDVDEDFLSDESEDDDFEDDIPGEEDLKKKPKKSGKTKSKKRSRH